MCKCVFVVPVYTCSIAIVENIFSHTHLYIKLRHIYKSQLFKINLFAWWIIFVYVYVCMWYAFYLVNIFWHDWRLTICLLFGLLPAPSAARIYTFVADYHKFSIIIFFLQNDFKIYHVLFFLAYVYIESKFGKTYILLVDKLRFWNSIVKYLYVI